jgi:2-polyprenyl-3-methyl-5-hydroxy-6-metoxy-1,4-benzoquinol methylase
MENIFTEIYKRNWWGDKDTRSGTGSNLMQTKSIIESIPNILKEYKISTILDIPCGDFYWMNNINLNGINYIGADIVKELIELNTGKYESLNISFKKLNLIEDELPKVDLIFCRDCLVHFSFENIYKSIINICNSQSKYFMTTTFIKIEKNVDIETGQWRPINFETHPFHFPKPIKIINEGCTENNNIYSDKSLGLWNINDIRLLNYKSYER